MRFVKLLAFVCVAFIAVAAVAAVAGYIYISNADHKQLLVNTAEKQGLKVTVDSVKLDVYPTLRAQVSNLKVLPFSGDRNVLELERARFEAPLLGLILAKKIDEINVQNAKIYLHRKADKVANWEKPRRSRHSKGGAPDLSLLAGIGKVNIEGGELTYIDETSGQQIFISQFSTVLDDEGQGKKRQQTSLVMNDVPVTTDLRFRVSSSNSLPIAGEVKLGENTLALEGTVIDLQSDVPGYSGSVNLTAQSLVPTLTQMGLLQAQAGLPTWPVSFSTTADFSAKESSLRDIQLALADVVITGDVNYVTKRKGASAKATLGSDALDLNKLGLCNAEKKKNGSSKGRSNSKSKGASPWTSDLIDLTPLRQMDFEVDAIFKNVRCDKQAFKEIKAFVNNTAGLMKIHNVSVGFGEQKALALSGQLDARQKALKGNINLNLNTVPLNELAGLKQLQLPLNGSGKFAFNGSTTQELASSLGGEIYVKTEEGTISGISATNLVNSISGLFGAGKVGNGSYNVALFEAGYKIVNGVARTDIFQLDATELKAVGDGKIDIGRWLINYKVTPKVGSSFSVPLLVKGPLSKPSIKPDLTSPQALGMGVGTALGGPAGTAAGAFIGNLLGGGGSGTKKTEEDKEELKNTIKNFLGN